MSQQKGYVAEDYAKHYLLKQGLRWVMSNYSCKLGEIDLIMRERDCLVFVEVRSRANSQFGSAAESITYHKQQKIIKTASLYLLSKKIHDKQAVRFDVVSLQGVPPKVTWIKNAFT